MKGRAAIRALFLALGGLALAGPGAAQDVTTDPSLPDAYAPAGPAVTGLRIDAVADGTELSIAAEGATFRVAPPIVRAGRLRVVVELPGAHLGLLEGPSLPADMGAIVALRAQEDEQGARLTIDLAPGSRFRAMSGAGGLLLAVQGGRLPMTPWAASVGGAEPPRIQPGPSPNVTPVQVARGPARPRPDAASPAVPATRQATLLPAPPRAWGLPASGGPVSASWTVLLVILVLGPPWLGAHLGRRRRRGQPMPAPSLHTVFPDGTRRRHACAWLVPAARTAAPGRSSAGRTQPPVPGRVSGR